MVISGESNDRRYYRDQDRGDWRDLGNAFIPHHARILFFCPPGRPREGRGEITLGEIFTTKTYNERVYATTRRSIRAYPARLECWLSMSYHSYLYPDHPRPDRGDRGAVVPLYPGGRVLAVALLLAFPGCAIPFVMALRVQARPGIRLAVASILARRAKPAFLRVELATAGIVL